MKTKFLVAAAVILVLLSAAGIISATRHKDSNSNVKIMESTAEPSDETLLKEIAELRAQVEQLEKDKAQMDFDYTTLMAERDTLKRQRDDISSQNEYLRDRNNTLSSDSTKLRNDITAKDAEIAALNAEIAQLEADRAKDEESYQEALARIEEYEAQKAVAEAELAKAQTQADTVGTVSTFQTMPDGQSRNIAGFKIGASSFDIDASIAILPHWFLVTNLGGEGTPDDFVEDEFPGMESDNSFFYSALFGTGLNWRFNKLQGQPDFYISTMLGPAWFLYKEDGDRDLKTYLLWRTSVGFDVTLHKNLLFTGDLSFDWIKDYGFTPRLALGLLWSFSNEWSIFGHQ